VHSRSRSRHHAGCSEVRMLDAVLVLATVAFFLLALAYVAGCDRL
jgi:hypothetical protein